MNLTPLLLPYGTFSIRYQVTDAGLANGDTLFEVWRWWGGCGISWTICKSFAPRSRQTTMPVSHHSAS